VYAQRKEIAVMSGRQFNLNSHSKVEIRNILPKIERTFLPVGKTLGRYRILEEVDRGGMAVVYKAYQEDLEREVALKVLPANITIHRRFVDRFLSEAHAVAKLNHPNIVSIHEVSMQDNIYYLVMDYLQGKNLFYHLNFEKPKLVDVIEIVIKLADALAYAHNMKIIHRDLKLNNVIMVSKLQPVLIDFGLAKAMEGEEGGITRTGEIIGSPAYMAPERLTGKGVDERSDICSLGIMLYEMVTFKNPYLDQRSVQQTVANVMESHPIPPRKLVPWLSKEMEAIIMRAMHVDKEKRYQSMDEFKDDLIHYQRGETVVAKPPSLAKKSAHFYKRHSVMTSVSVLITVFAIALGLMMYMRGKKEQSYWRLIYEEDFSAHDSLARWYIPSRDSGPHAGDQWRNANGKLLSPVPDGSMRYIRLDRSFSRDIQLRCEVKSVHKDFYEAGIFLYGDNPDSAYRFVIHHHGTSRSGIQRPGSEFLYNEVHGLDMPTSRFYHVNIRKEGSTIIFRLNGKEVARVVDYHPPLGPSHTHIGFFVRGSDAIFDDLRVYRASIPALSGPELAADRFRTRGEYQAALNEYNAIFVDHPGYEKTPAIFVKIADCYFRLHKYDEALRVLEKVLRNPESKKTDRADALHMEHMIYLHKGNQQKAHEMLTRLVRAYPASAAVDAAYDDFAVRVNRRLQDSSITEAAQMLMDVLHVTNVTFRSDPIVAKLVLAVLSAYTTHARYHDVQQWARRFSTYFPGRDNVQVGIDVHAAYASLQLRNPDNAKDVFNKCIVGPDNIFSKWRAWMLLAQMYAYAGDTKSAHTIYKKVFDECPQSTELAWMARIRMGEMSLAQEQGSTARVALRVFEEVVHTPHPFPKPRLIARYYLDKMPADSFVMAYNRLWPARNHQHYYYMAQKACIDRQWDRAAAFYRAYQRNYCQYRSWEYLRIEELISAGPVF
jgi:serine/threonine protein kinase/tetratricopeptide (TPR) repeat protein